MSKQIMNQSLISQIGGAVVMVCFFLPWASCEGDGAQSGAEMGGVAWLVFLAAGVIVASAHHFRSVGVLSKARSIVMASAIVAILVLAERYMHARNELGELLRIEYGGAGTFGGLILALYGSRFLVDPEGDSLSNDGSAPE